MNAKDFFTELAELLNKYNATIELERVWCNEYESECELSFTVDGKFLLGFADIYKLITHEDVLNLIELNKKNL